MVLFHVYFNAHFVSPHCLNIISITILLLWIVLNNKSSTIYCSFYKSLLYLLEFMLIYLICCGVSQNTNVLMVLMVLFFLFLGGPHFIGLSSKTL